MAASTSTTTHSDSGVETKPTEAEAKAVEAFKPVKLKRGDEKRTATSPAALIALEFDGFVQN